MFDSGRSYDATVINCILFITRSALRIDLNPYIADRAPLPFSTNARSIRQFANLRFECHRCRMSANRLGRDTSARRECQSAKVRGTECGPIERADRKGNETSLRHDL
jgi:hypothetical protein